MRIAVVTPHTLLNLGLKHLFQRYFDVAPALYNRAEDFFDDTPEQFDAYLLFADTVLRYSDFFLPRKSRIMLLTAHGDQSVESFAPTLPIDEEKECLLEFHSRHGLEQLRAGFGFNCDSRIQLNDHLPRRTAARAAWLDSSILELQLCCYETSFREVFRIDFSSTDQPLTGSCRFNTFRNPFLPDLRTKGNGR